jgi:hypothetical protein
LVYLMKKSFRESKCGNTLGFGGVRLMRVH